MSFLTTNQESVFSVKTEVFEGPMELLLELIEKKKLLINDISISQVTDDYISYVADREGLSLPNTSQFVQLAATLLLIKSKSLLPGLTLTEQEEDSIEDLEDRLHLYKIYKQAEKSIGQIFSKNRLYERRFVVRPFDPANFSVEPDINLETLSETMMSLASSLPSTYERPKVQLRENISLEQMVKRLHQKIESQYFTTLRLVLADDYKEPQMLVVGFLAVLESVKQNQLEVKQETKFGDIHLRSQVVNIPKYDSE